MKSRLLLRTASIILGVLGAGHLVLGLVLTRETLARWASDGVWAAVPLLGSAESLDSARNALAFWAALGSFSMPQVALALLIWHLAGRGIRVPASIGWIIAVWSLIAALILVPSPFILITVAGVLVIIAARRPEEPS